jgi:hypothetical protein
MSVNKYSISMFGMLREITSPSVSRSLLLTLLMDALRRSIVDEAGTTDIETMVGEIFVAIPVDLTMVSVFRLQCDRTFRRMEAL